MTTLIRDGLSLPVMATLGFIDVLALMALFIWLAQRYYRKHAQAAETKTASAVA